eukprot:1574855-Rhodomonas_salina.3
MFGTDARFCTTLCPVLTYSMVVLGCKGARRQLMTLEVMWCYAIKMHCAVLRLCMILPNATRCAVLRQRMLVPAHATAFRPTISLEVVSCIYFGVWAYARPTRCPVLSYGHGLYQALLAGSALFRRAVAGMNTDRRCQPTETPESNTRNQNPRPTCTGMP